MNKRNRIKLLIKERQPDGREVSAEFDLKMTGGNLMPAPENYPKGTTIAEFAASRQKIAELLMRLETAGNADGAMRVWI